jgi:hypothetical protein
MTYWTNRLLDEVAVHWRPPVHDGLGGYSKWFYPEQLMSRWQYSTGTSGPYINYNAEGSVISARTSVWVDKDIEIGSYLYKGSIEALQTIFNPDPDFSLEDTDLDLMYELASQVVSLEKVSSIPSKNYLYKAYLDET